MEIEIQKSTDPRETTVSLTALDRRIVERALRARLTDLRLLELFGQGKIAGTIHTCVGQEFVGAAVAEVLQDGDSVFSNHRCHGHYLSLTGDIAGLVGEVMGKQTGACGGIGGSQHLWHSNFYSNGILGGITPVAGGLAFARQLREKSELSVVFLGDGALGEGVVYETLNLASKWKLPLLFIIEDNGVSQSTNQEETLAGSIQARASAFGIATYDADTWDWRKLHQTLLLASEKARAGEPVWVHVRTFRLKAHSKGDDLRPADWIQNHEARDPLNQLLKHKSVQLLEATLRTDIERAIENSLEAPFPRELMLPKTASAQAVWENSELPKERIIHRLNGAFKDLLEAEPRALFFGEDVESPYGGAFKVSAGLSHQFPGRVRNTPISEAALIGLGSGLALEGFRPFVEIMFGDFLGLCFDQLVNHAAKFNQMYNGQVTLDLVVRTPMGGGRGYGPTHSQTLDRHFLGVPGLRVLALNELTDPRTLISRLGQGGCGPTLLIENKLLYGRYLGAQVPEGFRLETEKADFPAVWMRPDSDRCDLCLVGYGGNAHLLVEAADQLFEDHDLIAQVFVPQQIYPFDVRPYRGIFEASRKLVIIEEGQGFASFGSELAAQLSENGIPFELKRVSPPAHCIPASRPLEECYFPTVEKLIQVASE